MRELALDQYHLVLPLLESIQNKAVYALSVIDQTQQGRVFVNEEDTPTSVLITSNGGFYGLAGDEEDELFIADVVQFMNEESNHHGFFALGVFTTAWANKINLYHIQHAKKITRTYYSFNPEKFMKSYSELEAMVQKPFEYLSLNAAIAQEYRDKFYPYYQLVWSSTEQFCEHGIGHFIMTDDQLISVCSSPYVGGGYAEIDIITIEEFKRQGLACQLGVLFKRMLSQEPHSQLELSCGQSGIE
ncbi:GNAT family N-acetyltransferase [Paenibacillus sp. LS1]|uniref:GNAT family N-acetyltransferase n=1 Tax=Paenibacillus sp. LS1 TaxID=2992120 RepID=UPI0022308541|nr:GNAT family N-acetyltransferase [Paenibacillus sp. LS1]MCW3792892.1 GNAT family N-acetyltransferase [Paenibacillus sp. LS1]